MKPFSRIQSHQILPIAGLSIALIIVIFISPFASQNPDGLDRVAQDLQFESKAEEDHLAKKMPFFAIFQDYNLRAVPKSIAMPLAGLVGTIASFGLSVGIGKLVIRKPNVDQ